MRANPAHPHDGRGGSGSSRETMTTGRSLAAKPRSAVQTSPGSWFIERIQDFLFHLARPRDVEQAQIGQFDDLGDLTPNPLGRLRAPFPRLLIKSLDQGVHEWFSLGLVLNQPAVKHALKDARPIRAQPAGEMSGRSRHFTARGSASPPGLDRNRGRRHSGSNPSPRRFHRAKPRRFGCPTTRRASGRGRGGRLRRGEP